MRGDSHLPTGFPGDSVSINPSKTRLSFPMQTPDGLCLPATTFRDGAGRSFMKWCGLLVNCQTLELQADYTRYMGTRLADSMALPLHQVRSHWCSCSTEAWCVPGLQSWPLPKSSHFGAVTMQPSCCSRAVLSEQQAWMSQSPTPEVSPVCPFHAAPLLPSQHVCPAAVQPPGQQLPSKLCHYLRPKCHPLLLDATINSSSTVRLNIYQVCSSLHASHLQKQLP